MNKYMIILIGIVIVGLVAVSQDGLEGVRANPTQSTIDSSQTIWDTGKKAVKIGQDAFDKAKGTNPSESSTESSEEKILTEIGQIPCATDNDCNEMISECENQCICKEESCWK